jgi:tetratricopeptide (TPR) repeat protein
VRFASTCFLAVSILAGLSCAAPAQVEAPPPATSAQTPETPLPAEPADATQTEQVAPEAPVEPAPAAETGSPEPDKELTRKQLFDRGNEAFAQGRYEEALRYFLAAAEKGEEAPIYYNIGSAHFRLQNYKQAEAAYKKALELKSDYSLAARGLGKLYIATNRDREALEMLLSSLGESSGDAETLFLIGTTYEKLGDLTAAISSLDDAAKLAPGNVDIRLALARASLARGDKEKPLQIFKELVARLPADAKMRAYYGAALHNSGRTDAAIDQYETAVRLGLSSAETHNRIGALYYGKGMYQDAAKYFEKAIDAGDSTAPAYLNLAATYLAAGLYSQAVEATQLASRLDPESARAHKLRGDALAAREDYSGALSAYRKALSVDPKYAEAAIAAGRLEYDRENYEEAAGHYDKALEIDPDSVPALRGRGNAAYYLKNYKEAAEYYRRLVNITPQDSSARNFLQHLIDLSRQEE